MLHLLVKFGTGTIMESIAIFAFSQSKFFISLPQYFSIYNPSSHYPCLALRGTPQLGVVVTLVSISKIISEARTFNTGMSPHGLITVII